MNFIQSRHLFRLLTCLTLLAGLFAPQKTNLAQAAEKTEIAGPAGSGQYGYSIKILPNGNWVVVDPYYDEGKVVDVGAVYLYDGATTEQISKITGSTTNDQVGMNGIMVLPNAKFLIVSANWSNGSSENAGAITWCSIETGCSGAVSEDNSLVGSRGDDRVGSSGITMMPDGSYIVSSNSWDDGKIVDAGAVTWCSSETGCVSSISTANSLVGTRPGDRAGSKGIVTLSNGNYLVRSPAWDLEVSDVITPTLDAGAVTWCSGETGCTGAITAANSLVGNSSSDRVGSEDIVKLVNGSYVVRSPSWDREVSGIITPTLDAGAVTWCSGEGGCTGSISDANSLVGSTNYDRIGSGGVTGLANTNYIIASPAWDWDTGEGIIVDAGAITYCNGENGCKGSLNPTNSLVGDTNSDQAGSFGITQLVNGNYLVNTPTWDNGGIPDAGAVTWCSGEIGCSGIVTTTNSLVGSTTRDRVGSSGVFGLINGNYLVASVSWDNRSTAIPSQAEDTDGDIVDVLVAGAMDAGALTWCDGELGCTGAVTATNSLVGDKLGDKVGNSGLVVLPNGNFLVRSSAWNNGKVLSAGAVTWCNGDKGCTGIVSASNSLVGSNVFDKVGVRDITVLVNSHFVVSSYDWDQGSLVDIGAVTWCNGETGCSGPITSENSLTGGHVFDRAGRGGVTGLPNGNFVVLTPAWDLNKVKEVGAVTLCNGESGCSGPISDENSLVGSRAYDRVGSGGITPLVNSNYVIRSPVWDHENVFDAGAITWCDGQTGCIGTVTAVNSLVGSSHYDMIGNGGITTFMNGSFVAMSPRWNNGLIYDAGAVTWCDGNSLCAGLISSTNSLTGVNINDRISSGGVLELANDSHIILSPSYNNGYKIDAGAVTWCSNEAGCTGALSEANSLIGKISYAGKTFSVELNLSMGWLIITQPKGNLLSIYK